MADISPVITRTQDTAVVIAKWLAVTEDDEGLFVDLCRCPDRTVQLVGDFGTSGEITIEGSNDGETFGVLTDHSGASLILTDSLPRLIAQNPLYLRPRATAGTDVLLDVYIVGVSNK